MTTHRTIELFSIRIVFYYLQLSSAMRKFKLRHLKYILMWTNILDQELLPITIPKGQDIFQQKNCQVKDCFIVLDKSYLEDITDYDAILFYGPLLPNRLLTLPFKRSSNQTYVFVNKESPETYPICTGHKFDYYFNMTFTYKLDSDVNYFYFVVKNKRGKIIGPSETVHWLKVEDMLPISTKVKLKLRKKSKAAAWISSDCNMTGEREIYVENLQRELQLYGLDVDIFGKCGDMKCGKSKNCWNLFKKKYFFYLAFENSLCEDYVTHEVLNPLRHYVVPIVYGGADYRKFMADGMYLNAMKMSEKQLAKEIFDLMKNKERYYNYFRWRNHYRFRLPEQAPDSDPFCQLCSTLRDKYYTERRRAYVDVGWCIDQGQCRTRNTNNPIKYHYGSHLV